MDIKYVFSLKRIFLWTQARVTEREDGLGLITAYCQQRGSQGTERGSQEERQT